MAFSDYSNTPALNTSIAGINVAEGCPPANLNNVARQLAADGKGLSDTVAALGSGVKADGSVPFTAEQTRTGRGALLHHRDSSLVTGPVDFLVEGSSRPTATEGAVVFYFSA